MVVIFPQISGMLCLIIITQKTTPEYFVCQFITLITTFFCIQSNKQLQNVIVLRQSRANTYSIWIEDWCVVKAGQ